MKKMFLALASFAALGLVACGGESAPQSQAPKYDETVKAAKGEDNIVTLAGPWELQDGTKPGSAWDGADRKADMEATSVKLVSEVSAPVADKLAGHNIDWLYMKKGIYMGYDAGYKKAAKKADGTKVEINGSQTFKAINGHVDEEDQTFMKTQWIYDPKTAHAENLTPDIYFMPPWVEAEDADGFSWASDGGVLETGIYTIIVAKYTEASTASVCGYGIATVRTGDLPAKA